MSWDVKLGDCLEVLATLPDCSIDSVVTDPPYELGFMGKKWDSTGIAYRVDLWRHVLRVLKPGGHLLAFSGSRTYHRMAVAIEDAGFDVRDQIMWVYGSGFPKSLDVSKAFDKAAGAERGKVWKRYTEGTMAGAYDQRPWLDEARKNGGRFIDVNEPATDLAKQWQGWGTALKPAHEPIVMARRPLIGTVAQTVQAHGTGAINVDGCRVKAGEGRPLILSYGDGFGNGNRVTAYGNGLSGSRHGGVTTQGRWPANLIHDGSQEVMGHFPEGSARFFYCPKAGKRDRGSSNKHPTVKPTDLMRYLCRLVTPPGGTVLDPFTGSGSTGKAAVMEGFRFQGIEREPEYADIARARISHAEQKGISRGICGQCGAGLPCGNCHTGGGFSISGDRGQHQPEPLVGPYFYGRITSKKLRPKALIQLELFA